LINKLLYWLVMPAMICQQSGNSRIFYVNVVQVGSSLIGLKKKKLERIAFPFYYIRGPPF